MKVLSWGANTYGQLGHGIQSDQCILPMEISTKSMPFDPSAIVSIVGGGGHTLLLDKCGQVYSCGWNSKGQLGLSASTSTSIFTKIQCLEGHNIVKISCGWDSSMALTKDGILLAWGSNAYGQLGVPKEKVSYSKKPVEIEVPKIKTLSIGLRHAAMVSEEGRVFTCGEGRKGQLGVLDIKNMPLKQTDVPTEVPVLTDVQDVACGQHHTVIFTRAGRVFAWGDNKHGQLGVDPTIHPSVFTPLEIISLPNNPAMIQCKLLCGWTHTVLITGDRTLLNWGRNTYGQLGCHEFQRPVNWKPQALQSISDIRHLAVGSEHNIALSGNGHLSCWGWNEHGNCGIGTEEDVRRPTAVAIGDSLAELIGAGAGHCFALVKT